jgi:ribonuclease P protein subunit RPR2
VPETRHELDTLRAALAEQAEETEQQLGHYAAALAESFQREQEHAERLRSSYVATVRALANAVEARDAYTGKHAERVAAYGLAIARAGDLALADDPEIEFGFLLHDIGKVAIPDAILFKPERLTETERAVMERHTIIGWEILRDVDFLAEAKLVVRHHHERWDGAGYPDGLAGAEIPLAARVFCIADCFDALTTNRPYRPRMDAHRAREVIAENAGTQFDPDVVEAFYDVVELSDIARDIR